MSPFSRLFLFLSLNSVSAIPRLSNDPLVSTTLSEIFRPVLSDKVASIGYQIHDSCHGFKRDYIIRGINEAKALATNGIYLINSPAARDTFNEFFGNQSTFAVVGALEAILDIFKTSSVLFRCDDVDNKCRDNASWNGHWRQDAAPDETVICDRSYTERKFLDKLCADGTNIAQTSPNVFWGGDLLHRIYHMPAVGEGTLLHHSNSYEEVIKNAKENKDFMPQDVYALQYFALQLWAFTRTKPGVGCPGPAATT